ncbi:MAG: DUF1178 family protein [Zhengella sp.]|uniref:DUF1178 family protein n=1 Tax=Zhengella sp. TaxID=2282762 RepID=UPI001D66FD8D|nr:DUF1178 family protein [Notoacmeibacter sp.]MCC0028603.1 DUF1178 family protein [Brucellaceae bacterium]
MIRFSLACGQGHAFDGWFRSNEDFEQQNGRGLVSCPACGSASVSKALMAPAVSTARKREKIALAVSADQKAAMTKLRELAKAAIASSEDVGERFVEEARKIHYGEVESRAIRGEAGASDIAELLEEGVPVMPIPVLPDDKN